MNPVMWAALSLLAASDWQEREPAPWAPPAPASGDPAPQREVVLHLRIERAVRKANNWRKRNRLPPLDPLALEALAAKIKLERLP